MKTKLALLLVALALMVIASLAGPLGSVKLAWWNTNNAPGSTEAICLYASTNVALPMTNWAKMLTLPGTATNCVVNIIPGQWFFTVTASNQWGESPFSNTTNTLPVLVPLQGLGISSFVLTN